MSHDERVLSILQKLLEVQTEGLGLYRQTIENQQKALAENQANVQRYARQARTQRLVQVIALVAIALAVYKLFSLPL